MVEIPVELLATIHRISKRWWHTPIAWIKARVFTESPANADGSEGRIGSGNAEQHGVS